MNTILQKSQEIYWQLLGQTPLQMGSCKVVDTGIASLWMNGTLPTELQEFEVPQCVETVTNYFSQKQLPFSWWSEVKLEPQNLKEKLAEKGLCHCEKLTGLTLELDEIKEVAKPPGLQIQVVSSRKNLKLFVDVLIRSYEAPPEVAQSVEQLFLRAGLNRPILHFLGKENGKAVAAGSLFIYEGKAFFYHVATIPEKRKKGFGSFLMYTMLKYAQYYECKSSFLTSTSIALNMYFLLGFKWVLDFHLYL